MNHGYHHHRKRHNKKEKTLIDYIIYAVILVGPIMTIPQVIKIWKFQNAVGIAVSSWITYLITSLFWLAYAFHHKEKPLIVSSMIWIFLDILIIIGVVLYG